MSTALTHNGFQGADELSDLRRRVASLEDRWADVHSVKGNTALTAGSPALSALNTYLTQGHQYRSLIQGYNTKWTEAGTNEWVYPFALFFGGLVQLLAGMWDLWRNNLFGGTVFSCYGGFWLSYGLFGLLSSADVLGAPATFVHGTQMMLILWGCITFIFLVAALVINVGLVVLLLSLTVTFFLLAAGEEHPRVGKAGGYLGIFTAAVAWYIAAAELINSTYRRKLIPLGVISTADKEPSLTGMIRPDTL